MPPLKALKTEGLLLLGGRAPEIPSFSNAAILGQHAIPIIYGRRRSMLVLTKLTLPLLLVAFLHLGPACSQTSPNPTQSDVKPSDAPSDGRTDQKSRTYGKWRIICATDEPCRLSQSIIATTSKKPVLIARVYRSAKDPVLVMSFPLGVFLAPGVSIGIDRAKADRLPYETCDVSGCHLGVKLTSAMLSRLRKAKTLTVAVHDGAQNPISLKLDLDGFDDGLDGLLK